MNKKIILIISAVVIALIVVVGVVVVVKNKKSSESLLLGERVNEQTPVGRMDEQEQVIEKLPDFTLDDFSGQTINSEDLVGDILVIISWAASNPFSINVLPDLADLQEEFGDEVKIIAINRQENLEEQQEFLDSFELSDKLIYLMDPDDSFYKSIDGTDMPETVFVDEDGNIVNQVKGYAKKGDLKAMIEQLF